MNVHQSPSTLAPAKRQPHDVDVYVGSRIKARRRQLGISQEVLGAKVGLTFQQIQKYEKGTNRCGPSRLAAIAVALDAPITFFFPTDLTAIAKPAEPNLLEQQMRAAIARMRLALDAAEALLTTKH